jgi:hypothetical protein
MPISDEAAKAIKNAVLEETRKHIQHLELQIEWNMREKEKYEDYKKWEQENKLRQEEHKAHQKAWEDKCNRVDEEQIMLAKEQIDLLSQQNELLEKILTYITQH